MKHIPIPLLLLALGWLLATPLQAQIARHHWLLAGQGRLDFSNVSGSGLRLRLGFEVQPSLLYFATDRLAVGMGGVLGITPAQSFPQRSLGLQPIVRGYFSAPEAKWLWFGQIDPSYGVSEGDLVIGAPPLLQRVQVVVVTLSGGIGVSRFLSDRAGIELYGRFSAERTLQPVSGGWFFPGLRIRAGVFLLLEPLQAKLHWPEWDDE